MRALAKERRGMGGNRKEAKMRGDENEGLRINPTLLPLPRSHPYCNLYSKPHPYPNPSLVQNDAKGRFIGHIDKRLKNAFVAKVLKEDLGLRYRKVKAISWKGNSERCLVLR